MAPKAKLTQRKDITTTHSDWVHLMNLLQDFNAEKFFSNDFWMTLLEADVSEVAFFFFSIEEKEGIESKALRAGSSSADSSPDPRKNKQENWLKMELKN